jgi:hypothetical protein
MPRVQELQALSALQTHPARERFATRESEVMRNVPAQDDWLKDSQPLQRRRLHHITPDCIERVQLPQQEFGFA